MGRQLNIRSDEAYELAHTIARRVKRPVTDVVRDALKAYEATFVEGMTPQQRERYETLRALAKRTAAMKKPASAHDDMYDENGLPR
jgi:hypothetical protein